MFTVLLVENDDLVASYLNPFLRTQNINLVETMDVWLGSRLARELEPQLILIHLEFQTIEVYKLIKKIKQNPMTGHIPIVFISSEIDCETGELALQIGAVQSLTTPLDSSSLNAILNRYLQVNWHPSYCIA